MKRMVAYLFFGLYVLFEAAVWLVYSPPASPFDAFTAIVVPAVALWVIYWGHLKTGQGFANAFRQAKSKSDASNDR